MTEGKVWGKRKNLIIGLVVLLTIIIGLVVGILIFLDKNNPERIAVENITDNISASEASEKIEDRFNNELGYSVNDAINDYEAEMNIGNDSYKVYVAIYYANFIYNVNNSIDDAVAVLKRVESLINDEVAVDYYVAFRQLYGLADMVEESEFYNQKVLELMPQDGRSFEELMNNAEMQE